MSIIQLRRYVSRTAAAATYQPKDPDLDAVAASGVASAWTAYTPTVTANSGTFTSVAATGRYLRMGKVVFLQMSINITTNGTAAGSVWATLPVNQATSAMVIAGRETALTGKILQCLLNGAFIGFISIWNYDNTYPGGSGYVLSLSGSYEAA